MTTYKNLKDIFRAAADIFQPPERLTVSSSSEKYIYLNNPGAYTGKWFNHTTPYMVEPMDTLTSRDFTGEIFVGPAQSAKTQGLILNYAAYGIKVDPMDMIIFCPTQSAARDFSVRRIDRMHRHSEEIGAMLLKKRDADNKFDKHYTTGMILSLSWPTVTELAGRPVGRIAFTDRDRMDDDIDGDGEPFDLGSKRTTTFGRFAMTLAESSPSRPVLDPKWIRESAHQAPPCKGILGLYNRGDRRRWYWPCPDCGSYFEGTFRNLVWDSEKSNVLDAADSVRMACPHCDYKIHPDERYDMNLKGRWLKDGQKIDRNGVITGEGPRTAIASFWLNGVAAAFVTWPKLVQLYIDAENDYERTGSEDSLQKFYNNDLGEPYIPKAMELLRVPDHIMARAEDWGSTEAEPTVPENVRMLLGTIDVQKNAFVVQIHGVQPGTPVDLVVIDRFQIRKSERIDADGDREWVKPGIYAEDWDLITEKVIKRTYPLADGSGRRMMIKIVGCDSGGKAGVTTNAYNYYRRLRAEGLAGRFHLVKGDHRPRMPRVEISWPDSSRRDVKAVAQGDVPVMLFNTNMIKDILNNRLDCVVPGKGMIRFPKWLPDWFYAELCAEFRGEKGWENQSHARNEAWDLLYYCIGILVSPVIKIESVDWDNPPAWAAPWDDNIMIAKPEESERFANRTREPIDFSRFGQALA